MADLNKFEYGQVVRANIGIDVSTNTGLEFILQPKSGTPVNVTTALDQPLNAILRTGSDGVVVGTVDVVVGDETFKANEYLEYTTLPNDLSISGIWRVKGTAQLSPTNKAVGDYRNITVLD